MGDITTSDPKNPAEIGYSPMLPVELALRTAKPAVLKEEYGYTDEEWDALRFNPMFLADLKAATEMVKKEGMSFKLKARMQAEELLKTSWRLIHQTETPASVKGDLIKATMRWAGLDGDPKGSAAVAANGLNIQINLG